MTERLQHPPMSERFAEDLAEMAAALHDEPTLEETVERVLEYAQKAVDCSHAGVLLVHGGGRIETVAASDDLVARLDLLQVEHGGPDLDLLAHLPDSITVEDTATESRWPGWTPEVASHGLRSVLSVRLHTMTSTLGALNLYSTEAGHFTEQDREVAHLFARHAAVALSSARTTANLWKAIDARRLIGQAQGILMERFDMDADQAFAVLRRYSQDHNVKLHVVAERLVETRLLTVD